MEPPMTNPVRLLLPRVYVFEGGHNRKVLGTWNLGMLQRFTYTCRLPDGK